MSVGGHSCGQSGVREQPQGKQRLRVKRAAESVQGSRCKAVRTPLGLQAGVGLDNKSPARSPAGSEKGALLPDQCALAFSRDPFLSLSLPLQLQASGDPGPGTLARLSALRGQKDGFSAVPEPEKSGEKPRGPGPGLLSQKL